MGQAELLIAGLLVAVAGLSALARRLSLPYPIVLVIGGALLGFVPGMPAVNLDPNVVLVVFLPLLVYGAAFFANLNDIRSNLRAVTLSNTSCPPGHSVGRELDRIDAKESVVLARPDERLEARDDARAP